jgi:hypothetical protein
MRKFTTMPRRRMWAAGAAAVATMATLTVGGVTLRPAPSEAAPPCSHGVYAFFVGTWSQHGPEHGEDLTLTIRPFYCGANVFIARLSIETRVLRSTVDTSGAPILVWNGPGGQVDTFREVDQNTMSLDVVGPNFATIHWNLTRS